MPALKYNTSKILSLLIVCLMTLTSCCDDDKPELKNTHTILLYFPWSGTETDSSGALTYDFQKNIRSIENAIIREEGTDTVRVMLLMASSAMEGELSEIVYADGLCTRKPLQEYRDWSFTSTENLISMFNDVASYSPTPSYSMLIGGHGLGWLPKESKPGIGKAFGGTSVATKTDIDQLAAAIEQSQLRRLSFLCFDDCYMANIETAYELKDATDYIIASTSEIMRIGLPYDNIWTQLKRRTPDMTFIIGEFHSFYTAYQMPYGALSAIDCRHLDEAASLMRRLNMRMAEAGIAASDIPAQKLDGFNKTVFFDMENYTARAISALGGDEQLAEEFRTMYSRLIPAHSCTPHLYSDFSPYNTIKVDSNCGLTISDPTTNSEAIGHLEGTRWWLATAMPR